MTSFFKNSFLIRRPLEAVLLIHLFGLAGSLVLRLLDLFSPTAALAIFAVGLLLTAALRSSDTGSESSRALGICALLLALFYSLSPGKYITGSWDPGTYLAQGAAISTSTGMTFRDPAAELLRPELRRILYPVDRLHRVKTPGFYVDQRDAPNQIIPQFHPLYPTLLGLGNAIGGLPLMLRIDALCYAAGIFLLARVLAGLTGSVLIGLSGIVLMGLHPVVTWFARFHTSESLLFLLVAIATWSMFEMQRQFSRTLLAIAGLAFALLPWASPSTYIVILLLPAMIFVRPFPLWARLSLIVSGVASGAAVLRYSSGSDNPYGRQINKLIENLRFNIGHVDSVVLWTVFAAFAAIAIGILAFRYLLRRPAPWNRAMQALFAATVLLALYLNDQGIAALPDFADCIFVLIPLPWWIFAAFGLAAMKRNAASTGWILWLFLAAAVTGLYFVVWPHMPEQFPWAWKRWVWLTLPAVCLLSLLGVHRVAAAVRGNGHWAVIASTMALLVLPVRYAYPLSAGGEWRGIDRWLEKISRAIPDNALVMTSREFAAPLEFIYGHTVVPVYGGPDPERRAAYLDLWTKREDASYVILLHWEKPDWLPADTAVVGAIPPYEGEWVRQGAGITSFERQPRSYQLFTWTYRSGAD